MYNFKYHGLIFLLKEFIIKKVGGRDVYKIIHLKGGGKMEKKMRYYLVWVPQYVERPVVREFYNKDVEEMRNEVNIEEIQNIPLSILDIKREISYLGYKTYIKLRPTSWWAFLDKELKYKILYKKFYDLWEQRNLQGSNFYPVHYRDGGKAYVIPFLEYMNMFFKKTEKGISIREQLKKREERLQRELERKRNSEKFIKGEF